MSRNVTLDDILAAINNLTETIERHHERTGPLGLYLRDLGQRKRGSWADASWAGSTLSLEELTDENGAPRIFEPDDAKDIVRWTDNVRKVAETEFDFSGMTGFRALQTIYAAILDPESDAGVIAAHDPGQDPADLVTHEDIAGFIQLELGEKDRDEVLRNLDATFARGFLDGVKNMWNLRGKEES